MLASVEEHYGQYGVFYTGKGRDGKSYAWTQPESLKVPEVGDEISGRISRLKEFRQIKVTQVSRVSIVPAIRNLHSGIFTV